MHPLLSPIKRLGLYLLAWVPLAVILIYLLASPGHLGWRDAIVLLVPLCLVYQFLCLTAWYSCRATPIEKTDLGRLALTHLAAGAVISALWVELAKILAYVLAQFPPFSGLYEQFSSQVPVLFGAGFLLYLLSVAFHYVLLAMEDSRQAQTRALETSVLARDAELKALKAQVNPHFLFNSLNSISALTSIDAGRAREMCILLAEFLRMTLGIGEKALVPLSEELDLLQRFLAIEKVRFGSRLQVTVDVDAQAQFCLVPPLILQPLVENAVVHGIANLPDGGRVRLTAHCGADRLHIVIENSLDPDAPAKRKSGLGLANVRHRIEARYPKDANMSIASDEDFFRVTLSLPAEHATDSPAPTATTVAELQQPKEVRG
ncbi:MAG TPA: histidine kinase [Candidatus Acidoferrum sp.]|jgi:hypothetical protein